MTHHHHHPTLPSTSAYYAQRSLDAVAWQPWSEKAFRSAQKRRKPILLHIGYTNCYWCDRMASEAFRHPAIATYIMRYFVPIALDRNQRPDLANAYMHVAAAMTGKTGWPLNLFLTPEGKPYDGGTYFPPDDTLPGTPSFQQALANALRAWETDRERVEDIANEMARQMGEGLQPLLQRLPPPRPDVQAAAIAALAPEFDAAHGGFGQAPKFPQPLTLRWLLHTDHDTARDMALTTLRSMARGGIYDILGGGFHQYTHDAAWREPRFEKSLPTNALLARAYLDAHRLTGEPEFRAVAERTLDFILSTLQLPNGLFASGQSGESEGLEGEGRYFMWTSADVRAILPAAEAEAVIAAYGLSEAPAALRRVLDAEALAQHTGSTPTEAEARLHAAHTRLLEARQQRPAPPIDDTAITAWHALTIQALAEAAAHLNSPRYAQAAVRGGTALLKHLRSTDGLARGWYHGQTTGAGFLEDYAATGLAMLALHHARLQPSTNNGNTNWLYEAAHILEDITARFSAEWGYYDTTAAHAFPFGRPQELLDGDAPSGNALAATFLLEFAQVTHQPVFRQQASALIERLAPLLAEHPTAFPQWLYAHHLLSAIHSA